ncbi:MAG: cupin domain-containing protein [Methanomassiliicoccales archaeon]
MPLKCILYSEVKQEQVKDEGARGAKVRWLITKSDGVSNFAMRQFEVEPSGSSPMHKHPYEHEVFVLKGKCQVYCDGETATIGPGGVILIPPNAMHQFRNVGFEPLEFICMIPYTD